MKNASLTGWNDRTKQHEFFVLRVVKGQYWVERLEGQAAG